MSRSSLHTHHSLFTCSGSHTTTQSSLSYKKPFSSYSSSSFLKPSFHNNSHININPESTFNSCVCSLSKHYRHFHGWSSRSLKRDHLLEVKVQPIHPYQHTKQNNGVQYKNLAYDKRKFSTPKKSLKNENWKEPEGIDTGIKVYNSLTRRKERLFLPYDHNSLDLRLSWYSCGPTVYDNAHIGHARNYVCFDIIRRILEDYFHVNVHYAMNITDVDDKIINKSKETSREISDIATEYEQSFFKDMKQLGVRQPTTVTRVSEYIPEIIQFIETLEQKGFVYRGNDGIYFSIKWFEESNSNEGERHRYGKFGRGVEETNYVGGVNAEQKKSKRDFVLWKLADDTSAAWDSPWGRGRPGWHIECSAMIQSIFGGNIDIHTGGSDLCFPHHTNEIAQSEAFGSTQQWCNYFLHTGHLHIRGLKMSKSLKNFITIRDYLKENSASTFRIFCLMNRYTSSIDYSQNQIKDAEMIKQRFSEFLQNARFISEAQNMVIEQNAQSGMRNSIPSMKWKEKHHELYNRFLERKQKVDVALRNNFDTCKALDQIFKLAHDVYKRYDMMKLAIRLKREAKEGEEQEESLFVSATVVSEIANYVKEMLRLFGVELRMTTERSTPADSKSITVNEALDAITDFRSTVRQFSVKAMKSLKKAQKETESSSSSSSSSSSEEEELSNVKQEVAKILAECDRLRDDTMHELGVVLQDITKPDQQTGKTESVWKNVGKGKADH